MSKVIVDITILLDGFIAGPNDELGPFAAPAEAR